MLASLLAAGALAAAPACVMTQADRAWTDQAQIAWRLQLVRIPELTPPPQVEVILFDRQCRWSSARLLARAGRPRWTASGHAGQVRLADGGQIPAGVTSFASAGPKGRASFVMALPSIWDEAKVKSGVLGLDRLTKAVLLHEASHVAQPALMARVGRLAKAQGFGEDFSDDSIQQRFEKEAAFKSSVAEETRLLFAAAAAADDTQVRDLAGEALGLMRARRARWFTGKDQALAEAEDLFLSMEGAGQYVGYSWLRDPAGGAVTTADALAGFGTRARWWSQSQGLALVLAVERLGLPGWRGQLWGEPKLVGFELLAAGLAGKGPLGQLR